MIEGLEQFLDDVWGPEQGTVFLATKQTADLFKVGKPLLWPDTRQSILSFIPAANANWDTYFGPGIFELGAKSKHKENGWRSKCVWIDIDGYKDGQSSAEAAIKFLIELGWIPLPTYRIQTSPSGEHWYWILDDYITADQVNDINRRLAYFLKADTACWDISHVMRPPFTHNHKPAHKREGISPAVTVAHYSGEVHNISSFEKLPKVKEQVNDLISFGDIPEIKDVIMRYPWDKNHIELFGREADHFWNEEKQDYVDRGNAMVRLAYFGAEVGMSDEALYAILSDVDSRWGKFKDRNDRQIRLAEIITKVRVKYPHALIVEYEDTADEIRADYGFFDFLSSEFKFNWIYENVIPENTINFISARPGTGKSRFIMQLCMMLALGRDFLNWKLVGEKRKVLFFSLEMGGPILKQFGLSLAGSMRLSDVDKTQVNEQFIVIPRGEALPITTVEGSAFFRQMIDKHKPDVVFIDAMGSLDHDELSEKVSKKVMTELKQYLNTHKCTFYIVHHNKKTDAASINKPPTLNDFYGNTYGATDAASIISLWQNPQKPVTQVELHTLKSRVGISPKPLILDHRSAFTFSILEHEDGYSEHNEQGTGVQPDTSGRTKADDGTLANAFGFAAFGPPS
jgi:hypothetical protein